MIRILEILVSLVIVFLLAVVVGVFLPDHAHIERTIEVSNPLRQIYDTLNTFRRYPEYSSLRKLDPRTNYTFSGPESGADAKIAWNTTYEQLGNGSLTIKSSTEDSEIKMAAENSWYGENKIYTATLLPAANGKTTRIRMAYDVDYGWNLLWRYAGLYIHGVPDSLIQSSLANLSNMLASFPNVDYKDQPMQVVDVTSVPMLLVSTKAKRSLDDVEVATDAALAEIEEAMKQAGLERAGPPRTITTEWGDENYVYDYAIPVNAATFTIDKQELTIGTAPAAGDDDEMFDNSAPAPATAPVLKAGDHDKKGRLVVSGNVRGVMSYAGKALQTDYTGSPAALPLLRLLERAYAETHGYGYSEMGEGRFWDELISVPGDVAEDEQVFKVYLPIQF